jgi:REP element-mobilizing transposase RayT
MSRDLRLEFPGALWHVTSRGNEQKDIFRDDDDRRFFLDFLGQAVERFNWILYQYVLMSNHFHLVIELTKESLSHGMKWLNGRYGQRFNRRHRRVGHLFHGRPKMKLVEKETYLLEVLRYVALNPVRAGMVDIPEKYAWGSHCSIVGLRESPSWLDVDRTLLFFAPEKAIARTCYQQFVHAAIGHTGSLWAKLVGQIYLGSEPWVERMREKVECKPRSDEYPGGQKRPDTRSMSDVIMAVSRILSVRENLIRFGHGGKARQLAAWLGCREGLDLRSIAASLRLRSTGGISMLIRACESELASEHDFQIAADECLRILRSVEKLRTEASTPTGLAR